VQSLVDPMSRILRRSICMSLISYEGTEKLLYSWIYKASVIMWKIRVVGGRIILEIELPTSLQQIYMLSNRIKYRILFHIPHTYTYMHMHVYQGESVNMSQMDIKCKTCDIRIWKKHLFLKISFTNIDTLVPSLHECVNPQHRGLLAVVSATSTPGWASSATFKRPWENLSTQLWTALRDKHVPL
jgi:hypothetical protein